MDILVKDLINSNFAVSTDDGDKVNEVLNQSFGNNQKVVLDFNGITLLTTAFLNAAIGQLYGNSQYTSEFLNNYISLINVDDQDKHLFALVIQRAKEYFANRDSFEKNTRNSIYGDD